MAFQMGMDDSDEVSFASSLASSIEIDSSSRRSSDSRHISNASTAPVSIFDQKVQAKQATSVIKGFKLIVYLVILAGALIVWLTMQRWIDDGRREWLDDELNEQTLQVFDVVSQKLHTFSFGLGVLSDSYTSHAADDSQEEWPNVLLPDFDVRATTIMEAISARVVAYAPIMLESNQQDPSSSEELPYDSQSPSFDEDQETIRLISSPLLQYVVTPVERRPTEPLDLASIPALNDMIMQVVDTGMSVLAPIKTVSMMAKAIVDEANLPLVPEGLLLTPVFASFEDNAEVVGIVVGIFSWLDYLSFSREDDSEELVINVVDICEEDGDTFVVRDTTTHEGKHYDSQFCQQHHCLSLDKVLTQGTNGKTPSGTSSDGDDMCDRLQVQLGENYSENQQTKNEMLGRTILVAFIVIGLAFLIFDFLVQRRNNAIVNSAEKANAIISSLFPTQLHERMLETTEGSEESTKRSDFQRRFLSQRGGGVVAAAVTTPFVNHRRKKAKNEALADFFPDVTILFADIAGFTAWSSSRSPPQVLTLLETIYNAFDQIATVHGVFKVETIGDCYVAVCGLPEPKEHHAVVMARFARDCLVKLRVLLQKLEVDLGPDTTDLGMRIGLHSGCVTAGVLRGERARFQLFGDSVNTASRIETTGQRGKIHVSQETANRLIMGGKANWVVQREDKVMAKGKGELTTYWVYPGIRKKSGDHLPRQNSEAKRRRRSSLASFGGGTIDGLVQWCAHTLEKALTDILVQRENMQLAPKPDHQMEEFEQLFASQALKDSYEIQEALPLPNQMDEIETDNPQSTQVKLTIMQRQLLHKYVQGISARYGDNSFHNFRHASHVVLSASKLLSRVVSPSNEFVRAESSTRVDVNTFGILDPLTRFACLLSALVHSVDHPGVANSVNLQEDGQSRRRPHTTNSSTSENNAIKVAWDWLMEERFTELRRVIYCNEDELMRFHQILVNSVLATDILNKEQQTYRSDRWSSAFTTETTLETFETLEKMENARATLVIECLSQAGYVAHAMQHWHVYIKWTERFFLEKYNAFCNGDIQTDPCPSFYEEQIEFFDTMVIPLANNLIACGVFGVACVELLHFATDNREEWIQKGRDVVKEFLTVYSEEITTLEPESYISEFSESVD